MYDAEERKPVTQVKEDLPIINVMRGGRVYAATVSGRRNRFATVALTDDPAVSAEFSWESVARAVAGNGSLAI